MREDHEQDRNSAKSVQRQYVALLERTINLGCRPVHGHGNWGGRHHTQAIGRRSKGNAPSRLDRELDSSFEAGPRCPREMLVVRDVVDSNVAAQLEITPP